MIITKRKFSQFFCRIFAAVAIFFFAGLPGAALGKEPARFDHSGFVKSPGEYTYTVKCDPGEAFDVEVTASHPVEVSVFYKFLYDTDWLYRLEQVSEPATFHRLRHIAPSEKPSGAMKYWHYEVRVYPKTNEKTDYSLSVVRSEAPKATEEIERYAGAWKRIFSTPDGDAVVTLDFDFSRKRFLMTTEAEGQRIATEFAMSDISEEKGVLSMVLRAQRTVATGDGVPGGRKELTPNEAMRSTNPSQAWINSQGELYVQIGSGGNTVGPFAR